MYFYLPSCRATTEFTGWPTVSTTPLSIDKILQSQGVESIDLSEILGKTSSSTSTTVMTTTTTTTTVRPTQPGTCHVQCDLAGTIKIVDGVRWKPELLDHNTVEWKNLAKEVQIQVRPFPLKYGQNSSTHYQQKRTENELKFDRFISS